MNLRILGPTLLGLLALLFLFVPCNDLHGQESPPPAPDKLVQVTKVEPTRLHYRSYLTEADLIVDLTDLQVDIRILGPGDPLKAIFHDNADFKLVLLEKGLAKLRSPETASPEYRAAEERARAQAIGLWAKAPESSSDAGPGKGMAAYLPTILAALGSAGFLGWLAKQLYRRFYIKRRLALVILGDSHSGKTALFWRLLLPAVDRTKIENLRSSRTITKDNPQFIPMGHFHIHPSLVDTPGEKASLGVDELLRRRFSWYRSGLSPLVILFLLAPTRRLTNENRNDTDDHRYVAIQMGVLKTMSDICFLSKAMPKPRLAILFLNKFDLLSENPPHSKAARSSQQKLEEMFSEHIARFHLVGKQASVPTHVVIGSALEDWNCGQIRQHIEHEMYRR